MGFAPSKPWKWPCITHSDGCRNRKPPIDSAEQGYWDCLRSPPLRIVHVHVLPLQSRSSKELREAVFQAQPHGRLLYPQTLTEGFRSTRFDRVPWTIGWNVRRFP